LFSFKEDFGGTTFFPAVSDGMLWVSHPGMACRLTVHVDTTTAAVIYNPSLIQHPTFALGDWGIK
jgi:hypothetical protein